MKNVNFAATLLPQRLTLLGYDRPKGPDGATKSEKPTTWQKSLNNPFVPAAEPRLQLERRVWCKFGKKCKRNFYTPTHRHAPQHLQAKEG